MAIAPTGAAYKSLTFDNKTSREFGVYITGEAVYNAPEREVEMISIPGRNGAFALDKGRFENVPVTYPAGIFADNETDFAAAISDFRNYLCSRKGYCRLTDDYNPNEYRMAVYKSGLEVDPAQLRAGEFEITFDCKPQRWLTSGETKQTIANSGDTITNPTLFESRPLLEVEGYGTIVVNGRSVVINNETYGTVTSARKKNGFIYQFYWTNTEFNPGDTLEVTTPQGNGLTFSLEIDRSNPDWTSLDYENNQATGIVTTSRISLSNSNTLEFADQTFTVGTPSTRTGTGSCEGYGPGYTLLGIFTATITMDYDGDRTITLELGVNYSTNTLKAYFLNDGEPTSVIANLTRAKGYSTATILGHPTYIDCDIGEAYKIKSDKLISLNQYIDLGSNLPTLSPGANVITYDNTITDLKIKPQWWKV